MVIPCKVVPWSVDFNVIVWFVVFLVSAGRARPVFGDLRGFLFRSRSLLPWLTAGWGRRTTAHLSVLFSTSLSTNSSNFLSSFQVFQNVFFFSTSWFFNARQKKYHNKQQTAVFFPAKIQTLLHEKRRRPREPGNLKTLAWHWAFVEPLRAGFSNREVTRETIFCSAQ